MRSSRKSLFPLVANLLLAAAVSSVLGHARAGAQMVTGGKMPGNAEAFGLTPAEPTNDYTIQEIAVRTGCTAMANVVLPHESATVTFQRELEFSAEL